MSKQLAAHEPTLPGLLPDAEALRLAEVFRAKFEGSCFVVERMPTTVERQTLQRRSAQLTEVLRPIGDGGGRVAASEAIAGLLVAYGYGRNDPRADETITVYVKHLSEVPLFAIRAACEDVRAGRVHDVDRRTGNRVPLSPDKEPSTIRLRAVAQKHVDRVAAEKYAFDKVLMAKRAVEPPASDAERAAVGARFQELAADLARQTAKKELDDAEELAAEVEARRARGDRLIEAEYEALGLTPVRNSAGTLVSLSMMKASGWKVQETAFGGQVRRELVK